MLKGLSRLWWRGVKKINKAQQRQADKVVRPINQRQLAHQFKILNRLGPEHAAPVVLKPARGGKKNSSSPYLTPASDTALYSG